MIDESENGEHVEVSSLQVGIQKEDARSLIEKTKETFENSRISLPIYDEEIDLPENCYFRWDGEVTSLKEHTLSVLAEFGLSETSLTEDDHERLNESTGHTRKISLNKGKGNITNFSIGYILPGNENRGREFQLFNEAHEQAHMIYGLDKESFITLFANVSAKTGRKVILENLDEETMCSILGLLALELHNIPSDVFNGHKPFYEASKILKERTVDIRAREN